MTIEEKAKAYDKAIEKMKSKLKDFKEIIISRSDIEEIFPNLQESEDERIRKGMLQGFKDYEEPEYEWWKGVKVKECIAWLEKQGQSKKTSIWKHWKDGIAGNGDGIPVFLIKNGFTYSLSSCLGFECDYIELSELDNLMLEQQGNPTEINPSEFDLRLNKLLEQFKTLPKEELESSLSFYLYVIQNDGTYKEEKQGEQKSAEKKELNKIHIIDEGKDEMDSCFTKMMNGEKVSFAWNEEDYNTISSIKYLLHELNNYNFDNWLDSLKCKPQYNKSSWSEEDEKTYQSIIDDTVQENQLNSKQTDWLRNIKYRHFQPPKQKWSEEDEEQLNCIIKEIESELKKPYFEGYDLICNKKISWLKSLKQRLSS